MRIPNLKVKYKDVRQTLTFVISLSTIIVIMDGYQRMPINASTVGEAIESLDKNSQKLIVQGITSQGIFLKSQVNEIVFVTGGKYPGPLTINVPLLPEDVTQPGEEVGYADQRLLFKSGLCVNIKNAALWSPPDIPKIIQPSSQNISDVYDFIQQSGVQSLGYLIPSILNFTFLNDTVGEARFIDLIRSKKPLDLASLEKLLGWGRGLTPSGDDFLCGIALAISRYSICSKAMVQPEDWQNSLQEKARQKTTLISASILKWAFRGQSDKRIIDAFDEVLTGNGNPKRISNRLLSWGSSSGVDTFTGLVFWLSRCGYLY